MKDPIAPGVRVHPCDPANGDEIHSITRIYAHHVLTGTATFEIEPPSAREMSRRFSQLLEGNYPVLVATDESSGQVLGYAYCGPYRTRPAYKRTVEDSIYVRKEVLGQGIGRTLLKELIEQTKSRGYLHILAMIGDSNNHASIKLHRSLGFTTIGTAKQIGLKFDRFIDVVIMQLSFSG